MSRGLAALLVAVGVLAALVVTLGPAGDRPGSHLRAPAVEREVQDDETPLRDAEAPPRSQEPSTSQGTPGGRGSLSSQGETPSKGLFGRVVDRQGLPIPGALLFHGPVSGIADAAGRFRLNELPARPAALVAAAPGFQPARLDPEEARPGVALEVVIAGRALAITGVVVDLTGQPWPGLRVELVDGTPCDDRTAPEKGPPPPPGCFAETLASGAEVSVTTGEDGRFRMDGLAQRLYRLHFLGAGLEKEHEVRARAGEELRVEVPQRNPGVPNDGLGRRARLGRPEED